MVVYETLRFWPLGDLERKCVKDYRDVSRFCILFRSCSLKSLKDCSLQNHYTRLDYQIWTPKQRIPGTDIVLPEGMVVQLPSTSIMRDEAHFPNPGVFDPENFGRERREGRSPYAFLTFGLGPRNCVGSRLALLQLKVAVAHLVRRFRIATCAKTPAVPEVDARSVNADAKGGFWVRFERRDL